MRALQEAHTASKSFNDFFLGAEYHGPCPPNNITPLVHDYVLTVYALDTDLHLVSSPRIFLRMRRRCIGRCSITCCKARASTAISLARTRLAGYRTASFEAQPRWRVRYLEDEWFGGKERPSVTTVVESHCIKELRANVHEISPMASPGLLVEGKDMFVFTRESA
jgi:hypothetical protein